MKRKVSSKRSVPFVKGFLNIYLDGIILKRLDPLRAKKTFIRKSLGHTMVSARGKYCEFASSYNGSRLKD